MYRFFDKHGKKVLAFASALLMLAFLLPSNFYRGVGAGATGPMLAGKPLDAFAVDSDAGSLQMLDHLVVSIPDPQRGTQQMTFGNALFGPKIYAGLRKDKITWHLLADEARQAGVVPDDRDVASAMADLDFYDTTAPQPLRPVSQLTDKAQDYVKSSMRLYLAIFGNFQRTQQTRKISEPLIDDALALNVQAAPRPADAHRRRRVCRQDHRPHR